MNHVTQIIQGTLIVALIGFLAACSGEVPASADLKSLDDSISYAIGADFASSGLKSPQIQEALDINAVMLCRGFLDAMEEKGDMALTDESRQQVLMALQQKLNSQQGQMQEQMQQKAAENQAQGVAFLEQNKNVDGVVALPSGLQYKVEREGSGASPSSSDVVSVHYEGRLINGEVFDSSYERGEPVEFPVNGVIRGWTEALTLMKPGAKWQLFIPSDLAYGPQGSGPQIGPNSTLIFDVELLEVK